MGYLQEIDAMQRWVKATANLNSFRLSEAPPKVGRPVALLEAASRRKDRVISHYSTTRRISQYGKLYVKNLDQLADIVDKLERDLEEKQGLLPIFENSNAAAVQVGSLKAVEFELTTSDQLDVPFQIRYEVTYHRPKPVIPAATSVNTRIRIKEEGG
jgi:hypothetical protein